MVVSGAKRRSLQGKRMAASIAEFILMRFFFPDVKDRKKHLRVKEDFARDMQFALHRGKVTRVTDKLLMHKDINTYSEMFFKRDYKREVKDRNQDDLKMLVSLLEDFRFMKEWKNKFTHQEKLQLANNFRIKRVGAGQRVIASDAERIDTVYLVLAG